jgi:cytochrome c biogenesis protein CcdA
MPIPIGSLILLAASNAINPCAIAMLAFALIAILTKDPRNRKKVLQVGFAFALGFFLIYLIYGLILINILQLLNSLEAIKVYFYKAAGVLSLIIGLFNIKDFFSYGSLGFVTETPRSWRPRLRGIISRITSPIGGFVVGLISALFLTPCMMGPYLVCCSLLQEQLSFIASIPWLLLYNVIIIIPMIIITLIIYFGFSTVDNVYGWREKNLKLLHLITGIILVLIGLALIFGWLLY